MAVTRLHSEARGVRMDILVPSDQAGGGGRLTVLLKSLESFPPPALPAHASSPGVDFRSNVENLLVVTRHSLSFGEKSVDS